MEESEDNMSSEDVRKADSQPVVKKPKKRSLVERELETNMTSRVTSPVAVSEGLSTSRYGRARRLKTEAELIESQKVLLASMKAPGHENTPVKVQSPVYRMHASNSPHKAETPKKELVTYLDNQIDNIYQENISLSRFSDETGTPSPAKKFPKVYIRKDLIQNREEEETIMLIKNLFSPSKSSSKPSNSRQSDSSVSAEKYKQNGHVDNSSVVKTLDFDNNKKKKKDDKEQKDNLSKNELFEIEAKCPYQVGDLAWARMGTFPFWPCLVTRDPYSEMFVKKKLFGRVEHDIIHVTFFGDNGRRSWVVDNMLRKYQGQLEFESTRDKFTPEDKKKDPRLFAAFFVSEKKQALWNMSVEEAETLLREPKRLRIDIFNDMLWKSRASKKLPKSGKISRTNSDVSLSESLYDSLFSEREAKADDAERSKKSRNKSFDVSEVVTACLDNMAAKTGITKIQRQSHMDRWLQKAKSKTPEKTQAKPTVLKSEKPEKAQLKSSPPIKLNRKSSSKIKKPVSSPSVHAKPYKFRKRTESNTKLKQDSENDLNIKGKRSQTMNDSKNDTKSVDLDSTNCVLKVVTDVDKKNNTNQDISTVTVIDEDRDNPSIQSKNEATKTVELNNESEKNTVECELGESDADKILGANVIHSEIMPIDDINHTKNQVNVETTNEDMCNAQKAKIDESLENVNKANSSVHDTPVTSQSKDKCKTTTLIQDKQPSKTIKQIEEITVTHMDVNAQNLAAKTTHPIELSKKSADIAVEANSVISVSNVSNDSVMEVDENINDVESVQDSEKSNIWEPTNNSVMEVNERTNTESQAKGDTSPDSETVSSKIVEDIDVVTHLKEAQNVTIEVSVTEKKNDDTLNNLQQEGEQESIDKLNPSQVTETKIETTDFFDKSLSKDIAETNDEIAPKKSSTLEKYERNRTTGQKSSNITKKLNLESKGNFSKSDKKFRNKEKVIELKDGINQISSENIQIEISASTDNEMNDQNKATDPRCDVLNESGNSESILQACTDDPETEKAEAILETSFSESIISETVLKKSQTNESANENVSIEEIVNNVENITETEFVGEENQTKSTREYVESPTFTQLLDSEEFFRDVNETHYSSTTLESENGRPESLIITTNKLKNSAITVDSNKTIEDFDDDEVTSEDEPSPEYECLDDEITEDFRKHMMSIENNIKDKKNEEQIVKICNEIAEKAKLSPTKYTADVEIIQPNDKFDTHAKDMHIVKPKVKLDLNLEKDDTIHKEKVNTAPLVDSHIILDKQCAPLLHRLDSYIEKQMKSKVLHTDSTKDFNQSGKQSRVDIQTNAVPEEHEASKEIGLKINGNADFHEISASPKINYRTRSSVSSASKKRVSPDIKIESSKIEQYRKSCEYVPKVVIIRLERDKLNYAIRPSKPESLDEDNSKNNHISRIPLSESPDAKDIDNISVENVEFRSKNLKSRLSLKRDSPKSKQAENTSIRNFLSEIKIDKSENFKQEAFEKDEIAITATKLPKRIEISNDTCETGIPEPVKVNGYHHHLDRQFTDTPDLISDTDFDVDTVSLNSEDSEISLTNSVDSIPKRNLRSRPERTLEYALQNPEFLKYLELRQDYLMDLHPELNEDEVVSYVHKSWQYEEDVKSDMKKTDDARNSPKQETPSRNKKSKKPKNSIENYFREKYEKSRKTIDFNSDTGESLISVEAVELKTELIAEEFINKTDVPVKRQKRSKSPVYIDVTSENRNVTSLVNDKSEASESVSVKSEENLTPKRSSRSKRTSISLDKGINDVEDKPTPKEKLKKEQDIDNESVDSEDSEIPLRLLRSRVLKETSANEINKTTVPEKKVDEASTSKELILKYKIKDEADETASTISDNEPLVKQKKKKTDKNSVEDPGFIQYLEQRQDALIEENPQLNQQEIVQYLFKTWLYEENSKSALEKNEESEQQTSLVKGLDNATKGSEVTPSKKVKRKPKVEKQTDDSEVVPKVKPRRRIAQPFYNENYSDIEDELEVFEIFKTKKSAITVVSKTEAEKVKSPKSTKRESPKGVPRTGQVNVVENEPEVISDDGEQVRYVDDTEFYFTDLTTPKPNIFKGLVREKVCEICECAGSLVKCKACYGMFHPDCVKKQMEPVEKDKDPLPLKGRKKKRKSIRKLKSLEDSESQSDEKSHDMSVDTSVEDVIPPEICTIDADYFESQIETKMKEMIVATDVNYDSYSSDGGIDWEDCVPGQCKIVDVKLKRRDPPVDYSDYKCNNCQEHDVPVCFVCKSAVSKTDVKMRQKCHVAHCHKYYHLECLDHWPQTQFNSGEPSRNNKKKNEFFEALTCPRHVCHTCVSDDPRGCKTRFSGDKLAKCVRCPATYHSFNKCLPAGSRVLTASHIVCPRHSELKAGKVPCHVNTGWCFICAQGGSLICCEYCPTSFHAECLNIKPPEGNYMCEDCETGRLPLYGEMVWVKLGQYRWWPGLVLHPAQVPDNLLAVRHELGEFVVRFFGQYDHYWVNRGRVFPYQEGDSGRISSQKSKINEDFILAIEHAQRAYSILKNAGPDQEESLDIASSLLPPHYVKLKSNKPSGSLCGKKIDDPSLSLTQCECNPDEPEPCGPYSQCLNRMLLTECGPTCRAGERCHNRAFERRLYPRLVPYRTPQRGWGLQTLDHIKQGQFVIEYVGELIDEEEFRRRMRRKHEVRDENFYFLTLDKERMIDAGPKGNVARFMNHCCEPNCETQKWTVLGDVRVGLFAIEDIPANSEVTFNYNLECAGIEKKRCLCGAKRCSGYIGAKPKQDESQSKKGKDGKLKRTYNKKKKPEESPSTTKMKKRLGRPPKPKELTDLEKDVLIIKNATTSSDELKPLDKNTTLKGNRNSHSTEQVTTCNGHEETKTLKRKRGSISTEQVSLCNGQEPCVKKLKCEEPSAVGD